MPENADSLPAYPASRQNPLELPSEYLTLARHEPVSRVRLPTGQPAWLVTSHELAREALTHPGLSADAGRPGFPRFRQQSRRLSLNRDGATRRAKQILTEMDPPDHDTLRRMLRGNFAPAQVRAMRPLLKDITGNLLSGIAATGPPADLIASLAWPYASLVICEILGVPAQDRDLLGDAINQFMTLGSTQRAAVTGLRTLIDYLDQLVDRAAKAPSDDLIGHLARSYLGNGQMGRDDIASIARLLFMAGTETTANMLGLTLLSLLRDRSLYVSLGQDPERIPAAVNELLRFHTIVQFGIRRLAIEDVPLGPVTVCSGDGVIVALAVANRDPAVFDHPDQLNLDRNSKAHLSFSYGLHNCLGHVLARQELEVALTEVISRFPDLRVAIPVDELRFRDNMIVYGVTELPVTW